MQNTHSSLVDIRRAPCPGGAILFDASVFTQVVPAMGDAAYWLDATPLDGRGGRGMAVLVRGEFGEAILRHFRRGGLIGRWRDDQYLFLGESRVRSVREFRLLAELYRRGFPVPQPLLARWQRDGAFYRADLMTRLIPNARTLAELLRDTPQRVSWPEVGACIARFHHAGVFHADLNAHNVLVDVNGKVWLIDFDRGRFRPPASGWRQANLGRLQRSLVKLGVADDANTDGLLAAYQEKMGQLSMEATNS